MALPVPSPLGPMEATTAEAIPEGDDLLFEPKWDGFRCIAYRDGADVELQSKAKKSLTRYFPEMVDALKALRPRHFVLDGELVVPTPENALDFDALLQRIHPAESRVRKLAAGTPSMLLVFDLLATGEKTSLVERPLKERRPKLEAWAEKYLADARRVHLSPATRERKEAEAWLATLKGVDGVMVKDLNADYRSGERDGMVKVKRYRSADCVVGGFRESSAGRGVGSLLLGLFDDDGLLHHVGFTSSFSDPQGELLETLRPKIEPPGFTGRAPGGPSRWSRDDRSSEFHPLRPELVVEVRYDHFSGGRFRHGTRFDRWRPDKAPEQCTFEQVRRKGPGALPLVGVGG